MEYQQEECRERGLGLRHLRQSPIRCEAVSEDRLDERQAPPSGISIPEAGCLPWHCPARPPEPTEYLNLE